MSVDKDKISEFAEKTGAAITEGVKAGAKYTKEKAPLVGNAFKKFGHELKEIFTSKNNVKVVDVTESTEAEEKTESKEQSINGENTNK